MLTLNEHVELGLVTEAWFAEFPEETIDKAEHYNLTLVPYSMKTRVTLFDSEYGILGSVDFDTAEFAIAFIEEYFDVDDEDVEWMDSYEWAEEEYEEE